MNRRILMVAALVVALAPPWPAHGQSPASAEEPAVRQAVEAYFTALQNRDIEALKALIPASTKFYSVGRDGKLDEMSQERWHALIKPTEQNPNKYEMTGKIVTVDVSGSTAAVKSTVEFPRYVFHEYIAMLKIEGRWTMVSKVFELRPKPAAK